MAEASAKKQCDILQKIERHVEAIQDLVQGHEPQENGEESESHTSCDSKECGNSCSVLAIAGYIENIRKILDEKKKNPPLSPIVHTPPNPIGQAGDPAADEHSSCRTALENSVILRSIMSFLDTPALLDLRLVAKIWETEATSQLLSYRRHKQFYKVRFYWNDEELVFRNEVGTLTEFTESCCSNPLRKFPCSLFEFLDVTTGVEIRETPRPSDLSNFLLKHGHHIRNLRLSSFSCSISALAILRQILGSTPRLESLNLHFPWEEYSRTLEIPGNAESIPLEFPCTPLVELQELSIETPYPTDPCDQSKRFVQCILSAAPNLRRISVPDFFFTGEIVSSGKIRAVHHVHCTGFADTMVRFAQFSQAGPQLTSLKLDTDCFPTRFSTPPASFPPNLQLILESSRLTLKTLTLSGRLDLAIENGWMEIPLMENVEELYLDGWSEFQGGRGRILPPGCSLQGSFPRLKILRINGVQDDSEDDNPLGCTDNSSTSVEQLTIYPKDVSFFGDEWLSQAYSLYPNVRILHLKIQREWDELVDICYAVWESWSESPIEELHIDVERGASSALTPEFAENMDWAFTGLDVEMCRRLRKQRDSKSCQIVEEQGIERDYAILDMNNLKLFQITGKPSGGFPLFSRVSLINALEPMRKRQNLRMVINGVELEQMIQEGQHVDFWGVLYGING